MARKWWNDPWLWGGLGVVAASTVMFPEVRFVAKDIVGRGVKLTSSSWFRGSERFGIIAQPPEQLLASAIASYGSPVSLDAYSLARMIRSEGAASGTIRAHVALNDLKSFRYAGNLHELLTYSTDPKRRGAYGKQWSPAVPPEFTRSNARRYSTSKDPYAADLELALKVIDDRRRGVDPTLGATKFLDISSMGRQEGSRTFASVDAEWKADGYTSYTLPAYGSDLVLYRRVT